MLYITYLNTRRKLLPKKEERYKNFYYYPKSYVQSSELLTEPMDNLMDDTTVRGVFDDESSKGAVVTSSLTAASHNILKLNKKALMESSKRQRDWLHQQKEKTFIDSRFLYSDKYIPTIGNFYLFNPTQKQLGTTYLNMFELERDGSSNAKSLLRMFYNSLQLKRARGNPKVSLQRERDRVFSNIVSMLGGNIRRKFNAKQAIFFVGSGHLSPFQDLLVAKLRSIHCPVYSFNKYDTSKQCSSCRNCDDLYFVHKRLLYCKSCNKGAGNLWHRDAMACLNGINIIKSYVDAGSRPAYLTRPSMQQSDAYASTLIVSTGTSKGTKKRKRCSTVKPTAIDDDYFDMSSVNDEFNSVVSFETTTELRRSKRIKSSYGHGASSSDAHLRTNYIKLNSVM